MEDASGTNQGLIAEISLLKMRIRELEQTSPEEMREEIERRARQLTVLHETSVELTAELNLNALLQSIANRALNLIGGKSCNCYIYRPELDLIERVAIAGEELVLGGKMRQRGEGAAGRVWATGAPLLINDYSAWPGRKKEYDHFPSRALVAAPVRCGEEFLGILIILAYVPHRYTQADVDMLGMFATQAAIAIRNARLYDRMQMELTERRRAEEALRESEARFRAIFAQAAVGVAEIDMATGRFLSVNRCFCEMVGRTEQEMLATTFRAITHPEDLHLHEEKTALMLAGKIAHYDLEKRYIRKDGTIVWGNLTISPFRKPGEAPSRNLVVVQDVTERRRVEEEKRILEERLRRAEKMEALGQLAGGVAHDLNNVLGILSGYSELLLMEIPEGNRTRGHAEKILQSTEKGAAIIQDLLTLARRGVTASVVINLNGIVSDYLKTPVFEKQQTYHPRVSFRIELDKGLLNTKGSPVHLEKTLMNLVSNAVESISGNGEVTIRTENRYLDRAVRGYDEVKEGDYAVLAVSDTGMGIPSEHREKIFEPFYTKKTMGRSGTGLGLAIVWGTVKDHHGYIDVETEIGEGSAFTLYFPVTREERLAEEQKTPIEAYMGNGESILVVDDVAEQRDVAARLLTRLGYKVHAVSGGEEAVEYLKGNRADLLVLDMIMAPGIDGLETYERVVKVNPQQKAILVSGFSETDRVREAQQLGAGAYVKKPYIMEKIGMAIRDELRRETTGNL